MLLQGPSPDEVALVDAARQMGFVFTARSQNTITLNMLGEEVTYEILNVMEYTSDRCGRSRKEARCVRCDTAGCRH